MGDVLPFKRDHTLCRFNEPQDRAPSRRFSTTTFPYEPQGFTFLQSKVDVINGIDIADYFGENPSLDREMLLQMLHFKQRCLSYASLLHMYMLFVLVLCDFVLHQPE